MPCSSVSAVRGSEITFSIGEESRNTSTKEEIDPELDFIVIARPSVKGLTYDEVRSNLVHVLKLAKIIDREEKSK